MTMFCSNCGSSIADGTQVCPYCGFNNVDTGYPAQNTQSYQTQNTQSYPAQNTQTYTAQYAAPRGYTYPQGTQSTYSSPVIVQTGNNYDAMPTGKYRPLSAWAYFGWTLLYCIPIVGFVALIINSVSDTNINRRNHARSYWIALLVAVLIYVIVFLALGLTLSLDNVYIY